MKVPAVEHPAHGSQHRLAYLSLLDGVKLGV